MRDAEGDEYAQEVLALVRRALLSGPTTYWRTIESIELDGSPYPDTKLIFVFRYRDGKLYEESFGLWDGAFNDADGKWCSPELMTTLIAANYDEPWEP